MKNASVLPAILALSVLACAGAVAADEDVTRLNGSVEVADGQHAGNVSTVNGSVTVGANAVVREAHTVNGAIHLDHDATATSASTVNGAIHVAEHAHIGGGLHTVNGALSVGDGSSVGGELATVNGAIRVGGAHVGGRIDTVNGDIDVGGGAQIDGGIVVEEQHGWQWTTRVPRVVVGPGAVVKGTLQFKREVQLYVSDRATIGPVEGATARRFSGAEPPL
jgi:hypothetical protein